MTCRMCEKSNLHKFLDLGFTPPADQFRRAEQLAEPEIHYPLTVNICDSCGLVQLGHVVSPEVLYRNDYPYESSMTATGRLHWKEFATTVTAMNALTPSDLVVDVGSNVGVLLEHFRDLKCRTLGVDPAANIVRIAEKKGLDCIAEFFGPDLATEIVRTRGHAAVICATNVFAHVHDLQAFMKAVDILLSSDGVLVIEAPYLVHLFERLEYDTIYHEHLSYLCVRPMAAFFERQGFQLFDVQQRDIHGGSCRFFVARAGRRSIERAVPDLEQEEHRLGIFDHGYLSKFSERVQQNRRDLLWLLADLKHSGASIVGVSAPAKGMTLLNYCGIGTETLDYVTEKSTLKIGRFTPGRHIPVVPDSRLMETRPTHALLLAWNFADEIMKNLHAFSAIGGRFIVPIPSPRIVVPTT